MSASASTYDRASEIKAFDETKSGVKGLVDTGVTTIPRFFHQPPDPHPVSTSAGVQIPVIDLQGAAADHRQRGEIVANVRRASETLGFFQVTNHGVPAEVTKEMLEGVRRFHAQPVEVRRQFYTRELGRKVSYTSNFDLFEAPAANWRDSMFCVMAPEAPQPEELPAVCSLYLMTSLKAWSTEFLQIEQGRGSLLPASLPCISIHLQGYMAPLRSWYQMKALHCIVGRS